jgi:dUTP pyrophosphatase
MGTYRLKIWLDPDFVDSEVQQLYMTAVFKHNNIIKEWKRNDGFQTDVDAGFDLFVPETKEINRVSWAQKINHGVKTSMTFKGKPVSYYMYSRSSTPIKTPLRLANSVGIIDAFDNIQQMPHTIQKGDRLVQICSPNMTYPLEVELINSEDQFLPSMRGTGGFGSTG